MPGSGMGCRMNMEGMGWMMGGGAVVGILIIVLPVVGIAAGVKYLRFNCAPTMFR